MKKTALALKMLSLLLVCTVIGAVLVNSAAANPEAYPWTGVPTITIHSPLNNSALTPDAVAVNFTITKPKSFWLVSYRVPSNNSIILGNKLSHFDIVIDGELYRTIKNNNDLSSPLDSCTYPANLKDGAHNLTVKVYCEGWDIEIHGLWEHPLQYNGASDVVYFTVDSAAPSVSVLSPENKFYESTEQTLNLNFTFTVNEPASKITYSLDGQANKTVAGNTSLTNLPHGEHNVTVYAVDKAGNIGKSETITFTAAEPTPEPSSAMPLVVASGVSVAAASLSLLVYFKKRKR